MVVLAAYSGEVSECQGFLMQCQLYFEMLPHQFSGVHAKIAFIISLLSGKARRWAESMWTTESLVMQSLDPFLVHFKDVFGTSTSALSVHDELFSLRQANRAIHNYTLQFRTLAASSGWNEGHLLTPHPPAAPQHQNLCRRTSTAYQPTNANVVYTKGYACTVEKMTKSSKPAQPILHAQRNPTRYRITTIQGKPLGKGLVQWKTLELTLWIGCLHEETLSLLVLEESAVDVVLGCPWLAKHQPNIRWILGSTDQWSDYCLQHRLRSLPLRTPETAILGSTTIESPVSSTQANLPTEYQDYQCVFSQMAATKLPPRRPWDCAIELLPGAKLPKGRVYPLSIPENKAMEEYISEALQQGFI
ncbi:hypothetical protein QTP86_002104 [Hemibagrus guttatus]|nr:hypothetical protein QTP86_002104 [Hemibagrus guttatus]